MINLQKRTLTKAVVSKNRYKQFLQQSQKTYARARNCLNSFKKNNFYSRLKNK